MLILDRVLGSFGGFWGVLAGFGGFWGVLAGSVFENLAVAGFCLQGFACRVLLAGFCRVVVQGLYGAGRAGLSALVAWEFCLL